MCRHSFSGQLPAKVFGIGRGTWRGRNCLFREFRVRQSIKHVKLYRYIPLHLLFFLIAGIVLAKHLTFPIIAIVFLLGSANIANVVSYMMFRKKYFKQHPFIITVWLTFTIIGIGVFSLQQHKLKSNFFANYTVQENRAILKVTEVLKPNNYANNYIAEVLHWNGKKTVGRLLVNQVRDSLTVPFKIDYKIIARTAVQEIDKPKNPYQFDYKAYLGNKQVYHSIKLDSLNYKILSEAPESLRGLASHLRHEIEKKLEKYTFKKDELAVIKALLLGQRDEISKSLSEKYRNAGAVHILAISGLHIGIILLFVKFILKPLERIKYGKKLGLIITVLAMWGFAFLAGLSASVVRAVTMFTAVAIAMFGQRGSDTYRALIISLFVLLLIRPAYLFEVGFQLSYLAVFFIVWLQPMLEKLIWIKWKPLRYLWQLLTVSIAAQIGVLPLTLYYFHQFPGLFFIANLIIIPILGFILISGIFIIILAVLDALPDFLAIGYQALIESMNYVISGVADKDSFIIKNIFFTFTAMLFLYGIIVTFAKWFKQREIKFLYVGMALVIGLQLHFLYLKIQTSKAHDLIIFHKHRATLVSEQKGENLKILISTDTLGLNKNPTINNYLTGTNTKLLDALDTEKNIYDLHGRSLFVIDSSAIYKLADFNPEIVLLSGSPRVNLDRVLHWLKPKTIVADGSNYPSYANRWEKTCNESGISFFNTAKNGAFTLSISN